ncbi:MAG TPA: class I SAM-dependent methyltransferase [Nocardioides sp.]|jgi:SAM-dependent methyltransferase|nr:class I SAM-dependent methyltransferase [uncultured Nocardioides sp.]HEX5985256.1 class I SAM-dependent methyltransferase [Nocardioides sp.]
MTTTDDRDRLSVAPGNNDQLAAWDGDEGAVWAAHPEFFDSSVRHLHRRLVEAAAVAPDDRVLDLGCGSGQCTRDAARQATRGEAVGIDLSRPMLRVAEETAAREGLGNVRFVHGDAQVHPFEPGTFDVAVSRTGAMFFADQVAAFTNVARALRPGGRLALVSWRSAAENEWFTSLVHALRPDLPVIAPPPDAPSPFRHADPDVTTSILTAGGFEQVALTPLDAPMYFGRDAEEGFRVVSDLLAWMVREVEPAERVESLARLRGLLQAHETGDGVAMGCAAWLITAARP